MMFLTLIVISTFGALSATDSAIDRQNNDNYDSLNSYKPTDTTSYSGSTDYTGANYGSSNYGSSSGALNSGGYYPRNVYEQLNQNRYNADLSGREFRPHNVFAAGILSTPSPYISPLLAQPRQYQIPRGAGILPYQLSAAPLLQSPGFPMRSPLLESQYSGFNSPAFPYGGVPRLGIGDSLSSMGQGYDQGNFLSNPYYGIGNHRSLTLSQGNHMNPYSMFGAQALYSSPYSQHIPNALDYANPSAGYMSRPFGPYLSPQLGGQHYQTQTQPYQPYTTLGTIGQLGYNTNAYSNGYQNYNNYNNNGVNSNSGLGSGQSGLNEGSREERNYASSASAHSQTQASDETPVFHSNRVIRRKGNQKSGSIDERVF